MESRWYLFQGQTLENTKISERTHALHITKKEWNNVTKHLDRKKDIQGDLDKEEEWKKYLRDGSRNMMEKWENSLENIRKRKEEERLQDITQKKEDRMQTFLEMRKEQEQVRKEYVEKVKKEIFMHTGYARELTGAFVASEVLFEREKQKEFKKELKKHDIEEDAKYAALVKENAMKEIEEKQLKRMEDIKKNKEYGDYLKKVISETEMKRKRDYEIRIKKEALDNIKADEQMECLQLVEEEKKNKIRKDLIKKQREHKEENTQRKIQLEKEEKELDEVIDIYQKAKHRIDCLKKVKDQEIKDLKVQRRDAVAKLVVAEVEKKEGEEERRIKEALAEKDAIEEAKLKAEIEIRNKNKRDRLEDRQNFLERREATLKKHNEFKKWEMLNRYKNDKYMHDYDEKRKLEARRKVLEYKKVLCDQIAENDEELNRERELEINICKDVDDDDHKLFFKYANEVIELASSKGRPTYPIEKVIIQYKKQNIRSIGNQSNIRKDETKMKDIQRVTKKSVNKSCKCKHV